jgi:hypothetical protein
VTIRTRDGGSRRSGAQLRDGRLDRSGTGYPATDHPDETSYQSLLSQAVE